MYGLYSDNLECVLLRSDTVQTVGFRIKYSEDLVYNRVVW
jgi:hypothetical protein